MGTTFGIKIDDALRERLKALAEARQRTPHWLAKEALTQYLDREEQRERERLEDEARWERYVLTGDAVDHDQARDWLSALAAGKDAECPG